MRRGYSGLLRRLRRNEDLGEKGYHSLNNMLLLHDDDDEHATVKSSSTQPLKAANHGSSIQQMLVNVKPF
jgi:hypothetical protein